MNKSTKRRNKRKHTDQSRALTVRYNRSRKDMTLTEIKHNIKHNGHPRMLYINQRLLNG